MSQHCFETEHQGEPIRVLLGWDRPVNDFFLVIERTEPEQDQDDYLYVSRHDAPLEHRSLAFLEVKLSELGIEVPSQMLDQVAVDQAFGLADRMVTYLSDGSFVSSPG